MKKILEVDALGLVGLRLPDVGGVYVVLAHRGEGVECEFSDSLSGAWLCFGSKLRLPEGAQEPVLVYLWECLGESWARVAVGVGIRPEMVGPFSGWAAGIDFQRTREVFGSMGGFLVDEGS